MPYIMDTYLPSTSLEAQCRGAISLVPLYFSIDFGQVYTRSDSHIFDILSRVMHQLSHVDPNLSILDTPRGQKETIKAMYDYDTMPLVTGDYLHVDDKLDPQEKARLLVQGIAGAVAVASRLNELHLPISLSTLCHELDHFAANGQLDLVRKTVETSHLFNDCLMMSQILDLIMSASHGGESHHAASRRPVSYSDYNVDAFGSDYERPSRNMGLPWGFTILPLN